MAWTDERVDELKKLWADGESASQIAARMGDVTRNAVLGKVHRLGLGGREKPSKPRKVSCGKIRTVEDILGKDNLANLNEGVMKTSDDGIAKEIKAFLTVTGQANLSNDEGCRTVIGVNGSTHYCGKPVDDPNAMGARANYCTECFNAHVDHKKNGKYSVERSTPAHDESTLLKNASGEPPLQVPKLSSE